MSMKHHVSGSYLSMLRAWASGRIYVCIRGSTLRASCMSVVSFPSSARWRLWRLWCEIVSGWHSIDRCELPQREISRGASAMRCDAMQCNAMHAMYYVCMYDMQMYV